ncbi:MAG TPA: class I SAM-dependent methyltransferase [Stackebrandtia sp.]|jgi:precorrin-6B methylase 2|uniref:class I SAM-dependent methyltransferase n=1 Tax=Stackebrandtia sp. TaxID=2023065 RepID=UPI002D6EB604|nr:class I SAM-dependent methyltransferase [Stackebrandtia sp.]HZE37559.1 class I SAM-dependent methyltransferase [Stackebrandtia sp.]
MEFDPRAFVGTAEHYVAGRPPYSERLGATLAAELGLDGRGVLVDVGCGPGVLELELAGRFGEVVAVDPEPEMLREGERRCREAGIDNVRWVEGVAEDLASLGVDGCRVVAFGQSFHRVKRLEVAEAVFDLLAPGGSLVLISHRVDGRPRPADAGHPPIPHDAIRELVIAYLGEGTRDYLAKWNSGQPERFEDTLRLSRFGEPRVTHAPGHPDLIRDVDAVVADCFSKSWAAPRLFGGRRADFEADLRRLLLGHAPDGRFWDWPGDTEMVIATAT